MLYPKNSQKELSRELFRSPTSEYRAAPFWAWNCELEKDELLWQLELFKKMGFGGAHMHVRTGMSTKYLSDEHMALVRACVDKSKQEGMRAYLYDEDRWPSGAAGGYVTSDKKYRARHLYFAPAGTQPDGEGRLIARYDVELDGDGKLLSHAPLKEGEQAEHSEWDAWCVLMNESPWYNGQTYANTLDPEAVKKFLDVTFDAYDRSVKDAYGTTVPSIFTDEPQFSTKKTLEFGLDKKGVSLPWTDDLPDTFRKAYGADLMEDLPELIWDRADGEPSLARYRFHDHVCERFACAFADQYGARCRAEGIAMTGHLMSEPTLKSQTGAVGEVMRSYRGFDIPGIDMLCNWYEYTTAKQAQSAVHQFGKEGMLSELDGVTNWDFDFRGHKRHGDWQAALGVTLRVPHLSWVSMGGEAKRDYPASISYQSPWWEKYHMIEDHFARVNTALTRGECAVDIAVVHPVESYWLHWGPSEQTALRRDELQSAFENVTEWLLFGGLDFDFLSESLLPQLCPEAGAPLCVGRMKYKAVLVPPCETIRSTTLDRLEAFRAAGGKVVFAGEIPTLVDAKKSDRALRFAEKCERVSASRGAILSALEDVRRVEMRNSTGSLTEDLIYQLRRDGSGMWLFIAHAREPYNKDISTKQDLRIRVKGMWNAQIWDSMTGTVRQAAVTARGGRTDVRYTLFEYDSLLLRLIPADGELETEEEGISSPLGTQREIVEEVQYILGGGADGRELNVPDRMEYELSEPNVLLLDQAEWEMDGQWHEKEEILRLDNTCREIKGWESRRKEVVQPWVIPKEEPTDTVTLRFRFESEIPVEGAKLAIEDAEAVKLCVNGEEIPSAPDGWFTDKAIRTVPLPKLRAGENVIEARIPFGRRTNLEWAYVVGDFGVRVEGGACTLTQRPETLSFGDIAVKGFPFYGGNVTYKIPVETRGGDISVRSSRYRGALQSVSLDGGEETDFPFPPYTARFTKVPAGRHEIALTLYGHRCNCFGPVHLADLAATWMGPNAWRSEGESWTYDYELKQVGVLDRPLVTEEQPRRN